MRGVPFPRERLRLPFRGAVDQNAIVLGDVDGDGFNELAVGSAAGEVVVFKGSGAWMRCGAGQVGHVTALCVGDLTNQGRNVLVVVSADGWCHAFDCCPDRDDAGAVDDVVQSEGGASSSTVKDMPLPFFKQRLPPNIKEALLLDANNDGQLELVVALTDRVVRTYQWQWVRQEAEESGGGGNPHRFGRQGFLAPVNKWEFGRQVGSVTANYNGDGSVFLIVSQPGGALLRVSCRSQPGGEMVSFAVSSPSDDEEEESGGQLRVSESSSSALMRSVGEVDLEEMASHQMRNVNVSSEIVGGIRRAAGHDGDETPYVISTLDGNLILARRREILWSLQLPHQLFCLRKLDVDGDGNDEVVVSSWSGHTYVVTQEGHVFQTSFDNKVRTFVCGQYAWDGNKNRNVFVYVTFDGSIHVFPVIDLQKEGIEALGTDQDLQALLKSANIVIRDDEDLKEVNRYLLYG